MMDTTEQKQDDIVRNEEGTREGDKYVLKIENFEGPLDLLWNLIKKSKIDIVEVSISSITEQYIEYLKLMEKMNISVATEFINMASELLYYKSKALLPNGDIEDEFFVPPLPPELVAKLLEYKKFQLSSMKLREMYDLQSDTFARESAPVPVEGEEEYVTMSLFDLLNAFVSMMNKTSDVEEKEIILDEVLVGDKMNFVVALLRKKERIHFREVFSERPTRAEVIASFLALLELAKLKRIKIVQEKVYGEIFVDRAFSPDEVFDITSIDFDETPKPEEGTPPETPSKE
jgi:segregation and condensation protein A